MKARPSGHRQSRLTGCKHPQQGGLCATDQWHSSVRLLWTHQPQLQQHHVAAGTQCHSWWCCAGDDVIVLAEDDDTYEPAHEPPPTGARPLAPEG